MRAANCFGQQRRGNSEPARLAHCGRQMEFCASLAPRSKQTITFQRKTLYFTESYKTNVAHSKEEGLHVILGFALAAASAIHAFCTAKLKLAIPKALRPSGSRDWLAAALCNYSKPYRTSDCRLCHRSCFHTNFELRPPWELRRLAHHASYACWMHSLRARA